MGTDVKGLKTIKYFAIQFGVTPSYIYKLIKEHKMESFNIDGIQFIDTNKFPVIPGKSRG